MIFVGDDCIDRASNVGPGTYVILNSVIPINGTLSSWCVYTHANSSAKLKAFRIVGSTVVFVGESQLTPVVSGLNSGLPANISVKTGDFLGFYTNSNFGVAEEALEPHQYYTINTDVVTDTPTVGFWIDYYSAGPFSIKASFGEPSKKTIIVGNISKLGFTKKGAFINKKSSKGASFT